MNAKTSVKGVHEEPLSVIRTGLLVYSQFLLCLSIRSYTEQTQQSLVLKFDN